VQILSKAETSNHSPLQCSHSRIASPPMLIDDISTLQRGHFMAASCDALVLAARAPQCGQ